MYLRIIHFTHYLLVSISSWYYRVFFLVTCPPLRSRKTLPQNRFVVKKIKDITWVSLKKNQYTTTWWYLFLFIKNNLFFFFLIKTTSLGWNRKILKYKDTTTGFLCITWVLFFIAIMYLAVEIMIWKLGAIYWFQIFYRNNIHIIWAE